MARSAGSHRANPDPMSDTVGNNGPTDGRRRKGEQRRRQLLEATMRVIERGGTAAVSQRVVAREAGLPPSAVTYYFATVNDLLAATLTECNSTWVRRLQELRAHPRERALWLFARDLASYASTDRARLFAEYELWLLPARQPELRTELERWDDAVTEMVARFVSDPVLRVGAAATINGLLLRALWSEHGPTADEVHHILRSTLR